MSAMDDRDVIGRISGLTVKRLERYVEFGWVVPIVSREGRRYSEIDLARLQFIEHLRADMAIGDEAVPVVLSLVDQIHGLRHQLRCMGQAIETQEEDVRRAITDALKEALAHTNTED